MLVAARGASACPPPTPAPAAWRGARRGAAVSPRGARGRARWAPARPIGRSGRIGWAQDHLSPPPAPRRAASGGEIFNRGPQPAPPPYPPGTVARTQAVEQRAAPPIHRCKGTASSTQPCPTTATGSGNAAGASPATSSSTPPWRWPTWPAPRTSRGRGRRRPTGLLLLLLLLLLTRYAAAAEELASTRLSLELGKVGIQSASPCSSSSSASHPHHHHHPHAVPVPAAAATGYGPRPRHMLTEAEKEAKRLRRVLANRESARQTILRRQAIRDELARKVADLSSQNENMKKEKDMVMQEYLSLKEANKQLKEQARPHRRHPSLSL
ncbi:hypothetical protein PVAP13_8NG052901 [Panicum virgatum]|uniref:BZIP domain-containing protein n=1 Tax=Panicum virgatum TaxID=38727 RepID=A0A8T0P4D9_PANVG|nr:hypothetical protein PVAP13_8NG052901 [Panicum virgatum]